MPFDVLPAIDLLGGQCVRLAQGRYDDVTVYDADPGRVARGFADAGARWIHVVDLDAAKSGRGTNDDAVRAILDAAPGLSIELGGGIRSADDVERWIGLGVTRCVIGTAALRNPPLVKDAAARHPGRIAVGIDARDGRVAVDGWTETSETGAGELAAMFVDAGVAAIVHTDIARDGMGTGPNLDATAALARAVPIPVIASGGVGSVADVEAAACVGGLAGIIVGRALYTGAVDLRAALRATTREAAS